VHSQSPGGTLDANHQPYTLAVSADCGGIDSRLLTNLKCLRTLHHLIKTFWGWRDQQLPDGTVIWTAPTGHTYVTTPAAPRCSPP
jgi:hypothetical protein